MSSPEERLPWTIRDLLPEDRPRWTVRRLMTFVATLAIGLGLFLGIGREMVRKRHCDVMVKKHLGAATRLARSLQARVADDETIRFLREDERREAETARAWTLRNAEYHVRWAREFRRLAWRPWADLPSDPPFDLPPDE